MRLTSEVALGDRVIHDKYLGTIFTKQQTGFDPQLISPEEAKERIKNLRQNIFVMDPLHGEELKELVYGLNVLEKGDFDEK